MSSLEDSRSRSELDVELLLTSFAVFLAGRLNKPYAGLQGARRSKITDTLH